MGLLLALPPREFSPSCERAGLADMGNGAASSLDYWLRAIVIGRRPKWTLVRIAVLVVTTFVAFKFVFLLRKVESTSMLPTLREGRINLINRLTYVNGRHPRRGDIVAIRTSGTTVMYIKRIIGLPGELIAIREGEVWIDGQRLDEPYVKLRKTWGRRWTRPEQRLGPDQFFVIGDNRSMRQDQHELGVIDRQRIVGKVVL